MTERTKIVLERLRRIESGATIEQMCDWMGCDPRSGVLTLGIMVRAGQIHRSGWTNGVRKSLWSLTRAPDV